MQLCYEALNSTDYAGYILREAPERILQFGEGAFLRAFADYSVDLANEKYAFNGKVVVVQPKGGNGAAARLNAQEGLYTLYIRGLQNGKPSEERRIISCISRCIDPKTEYAALLECARNPDLRYIVSNTTEAGIVFDETDRMTGMPGSFPAKLTHFLYERYLAFDGDRDRGFIVLPCELIAHNGRMLLDCVRKYSRLWRLGAEFAAWVEQANVFCSTLVDRIVSGYPAEEAAALQRANGYSDSMIDVGEPFGLWVIEGLPENMRESPLLSTGMLLAVDDYVPYRLRKVHLLNGLHTSLVLAGYLAGMEEVSDCIRDPALRGYSIEVHREMISALSDRLPLAELTGFCQSVLERFENPFIHHALLTIANNSTVKWRERVLPVLHAYVKRNGSLPRYLAFGFAVYMAFYRKFASESNAVMQVGAVCVADEEKALSVFREYKTAQASRLAHIVCTNTDLWGESLSDIPGFETAAAQSLEAIETQGIRHALLLLNDQYGKS